MNRYSIFLLLAAALLCGCTTTGRGIAQIGNGCGRSGSVILAVSGVCPIFVPVGLVLGLPPLAAGAPLWYAGHWLAGDETEHYDPDL